MVPGLSAEHLGARRAYEPILAAEVGARGEVYSGGVVYSTDAAGKLVRRLP